MALEAILREPPIKAPAAPELVDVRVLVTTQASRDHLTLSEFKAGQSYSMPDWLALIFFREGWGVPSSSQEIGPEESKVVEPQLFKRGRRARRA